MKKANLFSIVLLACVVSAQAQGGSATQPVQGKQSGVKYVNPLIGTDKMGHVFPGACVPFGIVQLSPDTDTIPHNVNGVYQKDAYKYCAGYQYSDQTIVGFSHTHLSGTGHSDLGDILLMPVTGAPKLNPGTADNPDNGYRSRFSHDTEKARPGYYEVTLSDYNVKAQLTATPRVGIHQYTYPQGVDQHVILDLTHGIYNYDGKVLWTSLRVENDTLVTGYRITNGWARTNYTYFAISFSKPITGYGYVDHEKPAYNGFWRKFNLARNFPEIAGRKVTCFFDFGIGDDPVVAKVALSAVSCSGALKNLEAEAAGRTFDQLAKAASAQWEKELEVIDARGTDDQLAMLYTSLYHTMINPSVYMDVDGRYRGLDHEIHTAAGFTNYTVFSLWDTFRAEHPLLNLLKTDRATDMVNSMLAHYEQSVHKALPIWAHMGNENWCMIGYHAVPVIADAIATGMQVNGAKAIEAMCSSANLSYYGGIGDYTKLGYVPFETSGEGASMTLEYAYDDWTIYNTARLLGNEAVAAEYKQRAYNYKNTFNTQTGFAEGRLKNGNWKPDPDYLSTHGQGFIEGNSWNYSFFIPQDVKAMINLMGGEKRFINRLDSLFTMHLPDTYFEETEDVTREGIMGNYVHGNEPSHHVPYLYAWTSQPWKTQYRVRQIMNRMYRNSIDGLCGNDDCGQMSAWYIFTAMGFYPVCPGSGQYVFGAPYLPYMKVTLGNGKSLTIKADKVSDKNCYVSSVKLNGKVYDKLYITAQDLQEGGEMVFEMSASPNKQRGSAATSKPYSLTE